MKTFLIVNGGRGKQPPGDFLLAELRKAVDAAGPGGRVAVSHSIEEAKDLVEEAAAGGYESLWMGGGDGTIHVLLNYAYQRGMALGVIPMGTVNALARSLGIPRDPLTAAWRLAKARPRTFDVGQVAGRKFVCFASVGFDAAVVHEVTGEWKRHWGRLAYITAGIKALINPGRLVRFTVDFDQCALEAPSGEIDPNILTTCDLALKGEPVCRTQEGYSLIVSKICNYGGLNLFPHVLPCSGAMETWLFRRRRTDDLVRWLIATGAGGLGTPIRRLMTVDVGHYMTPSFTIRSEKPLYLQLDGEAILADNPTELRFECIRNAVQLLVPEQQGVWETFKF